MKLFGHDFVGASKVLVIFVAVFLVASGVCGLEIAIASQMSGNSQSALIPFGILDLIVMVVSGLGIVVTLLFLLVRAIVRASTDPVKDDVPTPRDDGEDSGEVNLGVREKKLVTLACLAGILACGACFLPPQRGPVPPLPPFLASVHIIAVRVEDGTAGNLFDSLIMSKATTSNFNELWSELPVRAKTFNAGGISDATVRIIVGRKTASCNPGDHGKQFCTFELIASFTVTAADGRILDSRREESSKFGIWFNGSSLPETWNSNPLRQKAAYALAMTAGDMFLVSERKN